MKRTQQLACLGAAILCALASTAQAEPPVFDWVTDSNGCKVANPKPQLIESIIWSGRCANGFAEGPGTVRWFSAGKKNGVSSGTFKGGKLTGKGYVTLPYPVEPGSNFSKREAVRSWPSGSRLDGEFLDNRLVGDGILTQPDGRRFIVNQVDVMLMRKAAVAAAVAPSRP